MRHAWILLAIGVGVAAIVSSDVGEKAVSEGGSRSSPADRELGIERGGYVEARRRLRRAVFGSDGLPGRAATLAPTRLDFPRARAVRLLTARAGGVESRGYLLRPPGPTRGLIVYHAGHERGHSILTVARRQLRFFISRGYDVAALSMPLFLENRRRPGRVGRTRCWRRRSGLRDHSVFGCLRLPMAPFIAPVTMALNRLAHRYRSVAMAGLSGGGWTTVVAAAIDPRIDRSYPVAGSWPMYLRLADRDRESLGDFEQLYPPLLSAASYLDMYALAERQLQIFIARDPCCFAGNGFRSYVPAVHRVAPGFAAVLDRTTTKHRVSAWALRTIARDLRD